MSEITSILLSFRNGTLTEEELTAFLQSQAPVVVKEAATPKECIEQILNISSLLLGGRLPTQIEAYSGISHQELFRLLGHSLKMIPQSNREKKRDLFISKLAEELNQGE